MKEFIQTSGELFKRVQLEKVFPDCKTFVDSCPKSSPQEVIKKYESSKNFPSFSLKEFIYDNFEMPKTPSSLDDKLESDRTMERHIEIMWDLLLKKPDDGTSPYSTLLPLPYSYIIPGGRFLEVYYWDSYFTAEGLAKAGKLDIVENIAANFAYLVETYGHIPNGNRAYYLSRSQPPFFCSIVDLLYRHKGFKAIEKFLPALEKEYDFWMNGDRSYKHKDVALNRYWDNSPSPREESYREDLELCRKASPKNETEFYRHIRAAAESGWDFCSRWFRDGQNMSTIMTTELFPVDLNSLIYDMELKLSTWLAEDGFKDKASSYAENANKRKAAFNSFFWDEKNKFYFDFNYVSGEKTQVWSLAALYPLYFKLADKEQATAVAEHIVERFLKPGGLITTFMQTTQQWDYPNGWAPLHWIAVKGLKNYGFDDLAKEISHRFISVADGVFKRTGKMMEKYNVCDLSLVSGGGEYPAQDGFGWTNGIVTALLHGAK